MRIDRPSNLPHHISPPPRYAGLAQCCPELYPGRLQVSDARPRVRIPSLATVIRFINPEQCIRTHFFSLIEDTLGTEPKSIATGALLCPIGRATCVASLCIVHVAQGTAVKTLTLPLLLSWIHDRRTATLETKCECS
jgi:hypothetical protein